MRGAEGIKKKLAVIKAQCNEVVPADMNLVFEALSKLQYNSERLVLAFEMVVGQRDSVARLVAKYEEHSPAVEKGMQVFRDTQVLLLLEPII